MFISLPICFSLAICVRILQSRTIALAPRGLPARCQPAPARSPRRVLLGTGGNGSSPPESKRRKESGLPCTSSNRRWDVEHWRSVLWKCSPASFWRTVLPRGSLPASSGRGRDAGMGTKPDPRSVGSNNGDSSATGGFHCFCCGCAWLEEEGLVCLVLVRAFQTSPGRGHAAIG